MLNRDIPLNQGCLAPITIHIPEGSLLAPSATAAVVGGNVLTSQRVTDVVLKAFKAAAASQVCVSVHLYLSACMSRVTRGWQWGGAVLTMCVVYTMVVTLTMLTMDTDVSTCVPCPVYAAVYAVKSHPLDQSSPKLLSVPTSPTSSTSPKSPKSPNIPRAA